MHIARFLRIVAAGGLLATCACTQTKILLGSLQPAPRQRRYRSKITICDLKSRMLRTVYQAEEVFEAPNWSRDGKYLLVKSGGHLYRIPTSGTAPLKTASVLRAPSSGPHSLCASPTLCWLTPTASRP